MSKFHLLLLFVVTPLLIADLAITLSSLADLFTDCEIHLGGGEAALTTFKECSEAKAFAQLMLCSLVICLINFAVLSLAQETWSWIVGLLLSPLSLFFAVAAPLASL